MKECQNCGEPISKDFARVFGNNDNEINGCFECSTKTAVKNGEVLS